MMRGRFSHPVLSGTITAKHADIALLFCSFVTGLLDCATFNNWGAFVGMQTGQAYCIPPASSHYISDPNVQETPSSFASAAPASPPINPTPTSRLPYL